MSARQSASSAPTGAISIARTVGGGRASGHPTDLYYDATLGSADVRAFMARENPAALAAMETCFARLHEASLWKTRRNSIAAALGEAL